MVADKPSGGRPNPWRGRAADLGALVFLGVAGIVLVSGILLGTLDHGPRGDAVPQPWFAVAATLGIFGIWVLALGRRRQR